MCPWSGNTDLVRGVLLQELNLALSVPASPEKGPFHEKDFVAFDLPGYVYFSMFEFVVCKLFIPRR